MLKQDMQSSLEYSNKPKKVVSKAKSDSDTFIAITNLQKQITKAFKQEP